MISGADEKIMDALTKFGEEIGIVFQLADDIIDIASDSKESGKTPGTDLREGVPTLVTLFILESSDPADAALKALLSAPITDEALVAETILKLRGHSALTKSRELVAKYGESAQKHLATLPEGPAKKALVGLSQAVISRTS
jgi:heptaprenyl diphosphate synthase